MRKQIIACAGALALLSGPVAAQVAPNFSFTEMLALSAAVRCDLGAIRTAADGAARGPTSAAERMAIRGEVEDIAASLEHFQTERGKFQAMVASLIRMEEARISAPGPDGSLAAASARLRDELRRQILRMSSESRALSIAMARARHVIPGAQSAMAPQSTLRAEIGRRIEPPPFNAQMGTQGAIGEIAAQPALTPQDLAKLKQLRDTYADLDQSFLDALNSLYSARARALMTS